MIRCSTATFAASQRGSPEHRCFPPSPFERCVLPKRFSGGATEGLEFHLLRSGKGSPRSLAALKQCLLEGCRRNHSLEQNKQNPWCSKCGPWTSSIGITWEFIRDAESHTHTDTESPWGQGRTNSAVTNFPNASDDKIREHLT